LNISILKAFIADQRKAKQIVSARLGIAENIPAREWAFKYPEIQQSYDSCPFADDFRPHGYGLELQIGDLYIDYDYSEMGLADGFDSWRVFVYVMVGQFDNWGQDKYISDRIDTWIEGLIRDGRIERWDNLYYLTNKPNNLV